MSIVQSRDDENECEKAYVYGARRGSQKHAAHVRAAPGLSRDLVAAMKLARGLLAQG